MTYDEADYGDGDDLPAGDDDEQSDEIERLCRDALTRLEDGDADAAREIASEAVAMDDQHPFPLFVLGLVAEQEGDLAAARYLSDQALRSASTNADAIQFRAQLHLRENEFDDAEHLLKFGIVHNPDDAALHESLARVLLARGRHDEALHAAQASLRIDPSNHGAHAVRVAALDDSGDASSLLAVLRQAVQMHPDDPFTMVELAAIEAEQGNVDRARVLLSRAQRLAPRDPDIRDARLTIEVGHDHLLLRPLPRLQRWLREFPGGLAGFLLAFVVASFPLQELATTSPGWVIPVWALFLTWGSVAAYAWLAPPVLTARLNRSAARTTRARAATEAIELERLIDAVATFFVARRYGEGVGLLRGAANGAPDHIADELHRAVRILRRPYNRVLQWLSWNPCDARLLIALAAIGGVGGPYLSFLTGIPTATYRVVAAGCLVGGYLLTRVERRMLVVLGEAVDTARHIEADFSDHAPLGRSSRPGSGDPRDDAPAGNGFDVFPHDLFGDAFDDDPRNGGDEQRDAG
jgi:tetratricopeptide (TPR) repeat protein